MRVIGGSLKGRRYQPHKRFTERPTTDFARESLFNVLQHRVDFDGLHAVDLFAGTGAIGYELASRGAASVVSVEKQFANVRAIKKQLAEFDLDQVQVLCADVFDWLSKTTISADLVFADPFTPIHNWPNCLRVYGLLRCSNLAVNSCSSTAKTTALKARLGLTKPASTAGCISLSSPKPEA